MAGNTQDGAHRNRFLLGGASEAERERIEAEFFADEDAFQEMLTAEDDLIDAYARGELSADERKQFEERFLTSSDAEDRIHFARAFVATTVSRRAPIKPDLLTETSPGFVASIFRRSGLLQAALATIAIGALVGFLWLLIDRSKMNQELNALRTERAILDQKVQDLQQTADAERKRNAETTEQVNNLREQQTVESPQPAKDPPQTEAPRTRSLPSTDETYASNGAVVQDSVTFDLDSGSVRSGPGKSLEIPARARNVQLRLALDIGSPEQKYRAVIETPEGRQVWSSDLFKGVRSGSDLTAVLKVPSANLPTGDYVMFLNAERANGSLEQVSYYSFRVARK